MITFSCGTSLTAELTTSDAVSAGFVHGSQISSILISTVAPYSEATLFAIERTALASLLRLSELNAMIVPSTSASHGIILYVVPEENLPTPINPPSTGEIKRLTTV